MKRLLLTGVSAFLVFTSCLVADPLIRKPVAAAGPKAAPAVNFRQEFLTQINRVRAQGCNCGSTYMPPAPPLNWNSELEMAALGHSQDMNRTGYFDHVSKNGRTMKDRITAAGYTYSGYRSFTIGENIAWGQRSIAEVMKGWIGSPGHCRNLMNPEFKEVGVALTNAYWVQDFGGRTPFEKKNARR